MEKQSYEIEYTAVYDEQYKFVINVLASKINNRYDAEDLTQDIFLSLYKKFPGIVNPRKWINTAISYRISIYLREKRHSEQDIDLIVNDVNFTYTNGFRDARIIINEVIEEGDVFKNSKERQIFDLVAVRNLSFRESGRITGLSYHTLRKKYYTIQGRVAARLKEQGIKKLEDLL